MAKTADFQSVPHGILPAKARRGRIPDVGGANRNSKDAFRERVARYVDDDPALAERIRHSNASRSKTVLMLQDYNPTKR